MIDQMNKKKVFSARTILGKSQRPSPLRVITVAGILTFQPGNSLEKSERKSLAFFSRPV